MDYTYKSINDYSDNDYRVFLNSIPLSDQQGIKKIIQVEKRKQKILARILLKQVLKDKYHIDYNEAIIKYNNYGKPFINGINYNISHSYDYVIVATSDKAIGIDIEKIRKIDLSIMKLFCTDIEQEYILNSNDKYLAFWSVYTLKEAYFKMLGLDLSDLKSIEFKFINNKIICDNIDLNIKLSKEIDNYIFAIIYK